MTRFRSIDQQVVPRSIRIRVAEAKLAVDRTAEELALLREVRLEQSRTTQQEASQR